MLGRGAGTWMFDAFCARQMPFLGGIYRFTYAMYRKKMKKHDFQSYNHVELKKSVLREIFVKR